MAVEALLNPTLVHKPRHDLESILYIILFICTFVQRPGLPIYKLDGSPPIRSWFGNHEIREIGYRKLALLECYDIAILPNFAPYWHDFAPFVGELINACFPVAPHLPNKLHYEQVLRILKNAHDTVEEPLNLTNRVPHSSKLVLAAEVVQVQVQQSKRANSSPAPSHRDSKKGKRQASL